MDQEYGNPGAVILGGSFHSLGAARNLAKFGVPVCILDNGPCVSRFSRAVKYFDECPSTDDESEYIEFLVQMAKTKNMNGWVLFPSADENVRILAQHRQRLSEYYAITIPSWEIIQLFYDKRLTHRLAEERNVPIPKTYNPQCLDELMTLELDFPVVVKPAFSKRFMAATKKKAWRADNESELVSLYQKTAEIIDLSEILIQEFIPGRAEQLYSFVGFFKNGQPVVGMSANRLRQHPMEFGRASTYVKSVNIPELEMLSTRFLESTGFSGLAEVEFMYDQTDAMFKLLEVNPRIWGWHTIAIHAGLDLPYLAYTDSLGIPFEVGQLREGVSWIRLATDTPTAIGEILGRRLGIRKYLKSLFDDTVFAVFSSRDPLPFIADLLLGPYNYFKGRGF